MTEEKQVPETLSSLPEVLKNAQNSDHLIRKNAEQKLEKWATFKYVKLYHIYLNHYLMFVEIKQLDLIKALCDVIINKSVDIDTIKFSGIYAGRVIAKMETYEYKQAKMVLKLLLSNDKVLCDSGCHIMNHIALTDGINKFETTLLALFDAVNKGKYTAISIFKFIKFLCEEIGHKSFTKYSSDILKSFKSVLKSHTSDSDVRIAVLECLNGLILIFDKEFKNKTENYTFLMKLIIECCLDDKNESVELNGLICIIKICEYFYSILDFEMHIKLMLTKTRDCLKKAINNEMFDDENAKQCIEFWSTLAENETVLKNDKFMSKVLYQICDMYFECFQVFSCEDDPNDLTYDIRKASGASLVLISKCCKNKVIVNENNNSPLLDKIIKNINSNNWKLSDASLTALGSILDGPEKTLLKDKTKELVKEILKLMTDKSSLQVRCSATWVFGRICSYCPEITKNISVDFYPIIQKTLNDKECVAQYSAWILGLLADYHNKQNMSSSPFRKANHAKIIIQSLLTRGNKNKCKKVITACYEAINQIISYAPKNNKEFDALLKSLIPFLIGKLKSSKLDNRIMAILGTLTTIFIHLRKDCLNEVNTTNLMKLCVKFSDNPSVNEESLLCISAIANVIKDKFFIYIAEPTVESYLLKCMDLKTHKNMRLSRIAINTTGDILVDCSDKLKIHYDNNKNDPNDKICKFIDDIINKMLKLLSENDFDLKLVILNCFCDISLYISIDTLWDKHTSKIMNSILSITQQNISNDSKADIINVISSILDSLIDTKKYLIVCKEFLPICFKLIMKFISDNLDTECFLQMCDLVVNISYLNDYKIIKESQMVSRMKNDKIRKWLKNGSQNPNLKMRAVQTFEALKEI